MRNSPDTSRLLRQLFCAVLTIVTPAGLGACSGEAHEDEASGTDAGVAQDASAATATPDASPDSGESDPLEGVTVVKAEIADRPLAKLDDDWMARVNDGDRLFDQFYFPAQGLGPVYIRSSCGSCHKDDGRGPGAVRKMAMLDKDGMPLSDQSGLTWGNTVRPQTIEGKEHGINAPEDDPSVLITVRQPPATFGRGYLEAIDDAEIERVEAEQADRDDGISGRINWVTYTSAPNPDTRFHAHERGERLIGRFGLKARIATLDDFAADALQGDMGLTSPLRPIELPNPEGDSDDLPGVDVSPDTVNHLADYMRMLRIPARKLDGEQAQQGKALFEQARCNVCHVPSLHTSKDYALPPLADKDAAVFSDLLLHDMGKSFFDGVSDMDANPTEWRTAPLLGLRFMRTYLHDGRSKTIADAIEQHGAPDSEAADSVQRYRDLSDDARAALLAYVSAL
jgi:CxxC motif-containing protein (DUF1111 family)